MMMKSQPVKSELLVVYKDIERPSAPALKPCKMICVNIKCPFISQCWVESKSVVKPTEMTKDSIVKTTGTVSQKLGVAS